MAGRQRGFTLIEILVVVFIVGLMMSVAALNLSLVSDERDLDQEARRLVSLLDLALDDAMLQGRDFGVEFMQTGFRFVEFDPASGQWAEMPGDDMLTQRSLPDGIELELILEDRRVPLGPSLQPLASPTGGNQPNERYAPHLLIFSSGDTTAFELHVVRISDDRRVGVTGDILGNLEIVTDDELRR